MLRIIGLDLAITSPHKAIVMDEAGNRLTPVLELTTWASELAGLLQRARAGAAADLPLVVVMEPTGLAWVPVAIYLLLNHVLVYLVNSQQVADLRRFYKKHAKSDRIDAYVLAKLYLVAREKLHPLVLPTAEMLVLQRACKQLDWVSDQITVLKNKLTDLDRLAWLGGWPDLGWGDPFGPAATWCREHYYPPAAVLQAGAAAIRQAWQASQLDPADPGDWAEPLVQLAHHVLEVYSPVSPYLDFTALQAEACRVQKWLCQFEADHHQLQREVVRPLYRRLHPSRNLETLKGVGQDSAAVHLSFIHDPARFADGSDLRGWSGLVPRSSQSGDSEAKGCRISQAGPDLIKKYAYLDADVARRWDPQLAKLYYDQMVHKGKHHTQAVCGVATHLLDRIRVVLQQDRPYELRDVDGTPVTAAQARQIIVEKYTVPDEVRQRNNRRARRARAEQKAERQQARRQKRSRPVQ
jgi:transposase